MRNFKPVERPDRTVVVRGKSGNYVYFTEKVQYNPELKRSVPKRIAIGKLNDDGLLIPNQNYFDIFGNSDEDVVQPADRADYVSTGLHVVADKIVNDLGVYAILEEIFGDYTDKILDIALYFIQREDNAVQYFEDYGYAHSLFNESNFTDSTIGRLFDDLKVKDIDLFIKSWVALHCKEDIYISYDSTNMNCTAGNLELVEYGHAKDNPDLPQVNMSLAYNQTDNTPLMYEIYPGSIIDNSECRKMVERAAYYGCKNVGFILDRGYFSSENIKYFERYGYDYILMTKGNAKFVQEAINEVGPTLRNGIGNYIEEHELYGITLEKEVITKGKKYIHVYYNGIQAEKEKVQFYNRLNKMYQSLQDKVDAKLQRKEDVKSYETYFKVKFDDNGYFLNYQRRDNKIREAISKLGYFIIITSKKMSAKEALDIYSNRDSVEKVFRMEKSYLGFDSLRVHSVEKLESKMFISFISLIIRNELSQKMKPLYKTNKKEYTIPKVIQQLERIGVTKLSDEQYHHRYALTNKQKKILSAVGITEKQYEGMIKELKNQIH